MAIYESMVVFDGRLEGQEIEQQIEKIKGMIETGSGSLHSIERMGKRRLSYEIKGNWDGYYALFHFEGEQDRVAPLQRSFRLNESILRHMVLRREKFPEGPTVAVEDEAVTTPVEEKTEAPVVTVEEKPVVAEEASAPAEATAETEPVETAEPAAETETVETAEAAAEPETAEETKIDEPEETGESREGGE